MGAFLKIRKPRYFLVRRLADGTPAYYWHCKAAIAHGLAAEALGTDLGPAMARAEALNKLWDGIRTGEPGAAPEGPAYGTLGWWLDRLEARDDHKARPKEGRSEVEQAFKTLRATPLATLRLPEIAGEDVQALHRKLQRDHGIDKAWRACKWLRWAFGQATISRLKILAVNPMADLQLSRPPPRQVVVTEAEVERLVEAAHCLERPSIAIAVRLAYDLGQRGITCRTFPWSRFVPDQRNPVEAIVHQTKTDATIRVTLLPELRAELARTKRAGTVVVISEETGRPYLRDDFVHQCSAVFAMAGCEGKSFSDLRRAAVVRLAEAGCTIPEIAAVTGHSLQRVEQILETYLPRTTPMARAAIRKLLDARRARRRQAAQD